MKFVNDFETGKKVILEKFPEFAERNLIGDDSGWDNFAIRVDNTYLFRFPRREASRAQIQREAEALNVLQKKLPSHIQVPEYLAVELEADCPFVYYKMIPGEPLTKESYSKLADAERERLASNIVEFLDILHSVNAEECPSLERVDALAKYQELYRQITEVCFKYLAPEEQAKTERLFGNYLQNSGMQDFMPTVVHNDLSGNHILVTDDGIGVIDFGDVCVFDPAIDACWFELLDEKMFREILSKCSTHKDAGFEQRIRQFYVPIIPYYGIIYGEEIGDKELIAEELKDLRENLEKI